MFVSNQQSKMNILLCIFNLLPSPLENADGDGFLASTLMEVGEAAHGEVKRGVWTLVEGADGEVGMEEGEEKLEARHEGEPTREGERLG
jgi:hypothetical protein